MLNAQPNDALGSLIEQLAAVAQQRADEPRRTIAEQIASQRTSVCEEAPSAAKEVRGQPEALSPTERAWSVDGWTKSLDLHTFVAAAIAPPEGVDAFE